MRRSEDDYINPFMDERIDANVCAYCGSKANTKDHVPPKVFLDAPHPNSNFTVPACLECNTRPATDEEFSAVLFDALSHGTEDLSRWRTKTKVAVAGNPKLIQSSKAEADRVRDAETGSINSERCFSVLGKIAMGHWRFEAGDRAYEPPDAISIQDVFDRTERSLEIDEYVSSVLGSQDIYPELGSRAFIRFFQGISPRWTSWRSVQENRYEYRMGNNGLAVCINNRYLCIAKWSESYRGSMFQGEVRTWRSRVEPWPFLSQQKLG